MTAERIEALCYAVRCRVLLKHLGMLGVMLAALNSVPLSVAVLLGEFEVAERYVGVLVALLREADPSRTDFLFCLTGNDQTNILASLAGRSLGYGRVVPKIDDPEFEHLCIEHRPLSRGHVRGP